MVKAKRVIYLHCCDDSLNSCKRMRMLTSLRPGALMLDMSTCGPDTAALLGAAFDRAGRRFVDCPVSRKAPGMTALVGGTPGVLGDAADVLDRVSRSVIYCGFCGAGYATKLLNQHVKYAWYLASAGALVLARQFGLDPAVTASAIEQSSGGESGCSTAAKYFRDDMDGMLAHARPAPSKKTWTSPRRWRQPRAFAAPPSTSQPTSSPQSALPRSGISPTRAAARSSPTCASPGGMSIVERIRAAECAGRVAVSDGPVTRRPGYLSARAAPRARVQACCWVSWFTAVPMPR
jgi:hypothetical protein